MSPEERALLRWTDEPLTFVRDCIGVEPYPWQARELVELPKHKRIAIAGSKGAAKTALEAWVIWWTMTTQPNCRIAATSINGDNLRDNLWTELAKWHARAPLLQSLFKWSPERIVRITEPATWWAVARTWNQSADPNLIGQAVAGLHEENALFVIDEAGGVPQALLSAADAVLSTKKPGHQARVLIGGNTTSVAGALYLAITKQRDLWRCVHVTGDPDDPMRSPNVDPEWAREMIKAYGRENPWVKVNVFAEFPEQALGRLLSITDLEAAAKREVQDDPRQPLVLGVDVGTAMDATVIYPRRGRLLMTPKVLRGASTIVIASEVTKLYRELGVKTVFVDAGGPGIGVIDQLRLLGVPVVPVYFGGAADDPSRFENKRIEMHVRLAEWIKEGGSIGHCIELFQDLTEGDVTWNLKGQQLMEPKKEISKRLGRSPDWGDGAALTFAYPVAARAPTQEEVDRDPRLRAIREHMMPQQHDEFGFGGG